MADNVFYNDYYRKHTDVVAIVDAVRAVERRSGVVGGRVYASRSLSLSVSMDVTGPKR